MIWVMFAVLIVALTLVYVRLAPLDPTVLHQPVRAEADGDGEGFCVRVLQGDAAVFARLDGLMRALPRTQVLAGSVEEGRVSYVTRSRWIGFPDITTSEFDGAQIKMFARLRFGRSDFGVNRARLSQVIRAAG